MSSSFEFESPVNTPSIYAQLYLHLSIQVYLHRFKCLGLILQEGNLKKVKQGDVVASLHKLEVSYKNFFTGKIFRKITSITQCLTYANLKSDCLYCFGWLTYLQGDWYCIPFEISH